MIKFQWVPKLPGDILNSNVIIQLREVCSQELFLVHIHSVRAWEIEIHFSVGTSLGKLFRAEREIF